MIGYFATPTCIRIYFYSFMMCYYAGHWNGECHKAFNYTALAYLSNESNQRGLIRISNIRAHVLDLFNIHKLKLKPQDYSNQLAYKKYLLDI